MHRKKIAVSLMALVVLAVIPAFGDDDSRSQRNDHQQNRRHLGGEVRGGNHDGGAHR